MLVSELGGVNWLWAFMVNGQIIWPKFMATSSFGKFMFTPPSSGEMSEVPQKSDNSSSQLWHLVGTPHMASFSPCGHGAMRA